MEKSVLKHTGWLMLIVLAVLLLLNLLPGGTIGGHVLRRVDILGDVRPVPEVVSEPDSLLPPPPKVKPAFVDTCRSGMTCIEDYSDSTLRGMTPFYRALDELAVKPRPVRIAYFGDSFIEADILTADLRAMLQEPLWRLRGRLRDDYFSGQRLSAYGAAQLWRLAEPFRYGLRILRPWQARCFGPLFYSDSRSVRRTWRTEEVCFPARYLRTCFYLLL